MGNGTKASLKDSEALVEFQHSLEFFSGSVERLMDAVSDYLNDVKLEMERHIALLEQAVKDSEEDAERARAEQDRAYDDWQSVKEARLSVMYSSDEEDTGAYDQLYSMECEAESMYHQAKIAYEQCLEAVRRAENNLDEGKSILNEFYRCEDEYRADYSLIYSPGGDALMRFVAKKDVRDSIKHLQKIIDVVSEYCSCPMSLEGRTSASVRTDTYQRPGRRAMELRREEAMDDVGYRMRRERPNKMPNPDTLVRCKICGRPFAICRCKPSILPDVKA